MADVFNLALLQEAVADALPERELIVFRGRRLTRDQYRKRARRLANYLMSRGLGGKVRAERKDLQPWESGQDHLGLYLYNGNEYLEGMTGSYAARVAPFNVNYRYVDDELEYLLKDAKARAVIYHACFAPTLARIRKKLPHLEVLLQVADDSGNALLDGAVDYEAALAASSDDRPSCEPSADDLYILYTGGTTGMPKGVLWRQEDIFFAALGGTLPTGQKVGAVSHLLNMAKAMGPMLRTFPLPPFMHGAAHWVAHMAIHMGGTIFIQDHPDRFDADEILALAEREKISTVLIVGDAFAVPLIDQLKKKQYDLSKLTTIGSGGAILSPTHKEELMRLLPKTMITDALGSSESGAQGAVMSAGGKAQSRFKLGTGNVVLSEDLTRVLEPGCGESGWLARQGHIPLGYLGDPEKTKKTFIALGGLRYSIPGDHARPEADGTLTLFGRGSVSINSGGEKIYPEEVEKALKSHPDIYDAVVVGTPHEKWGQQVTAVVQARGERRPNPEELLARCKEHLAGYKLPKDIIWVERIVRSPAGKADYRWAKQVAEKELGGGEGKGT